MTAAFGLETLTSKFLPFSIIIAIGFVISMVLWVKNRKEGAEPSGEASQEA